MFGIIATEKTCIYNDTADDARQPETNDAPVVAGGAAAPRFPSIHPLSQIGVFAFDENRRGGLQQIFFGRKKLVIGDQHCATEFF